MPCKRCYTIGYRRRRTKKKNELGQNSPPANTQAQTATAQPRASHIDSPSAEKEKPKSAGLSLKNYASLKHKVQQEHVEELAKNEIGESLIISISAFLEVWNEFAAEVREAGKKSLYLLMSQSEPICTAKNVFNISVSTETLKETFNLEKSALVEKLTQKFSTNKFEIIVQVADNSTEEKQKFLSTPKEKFDHMQQINPELKNLMDELGLDFN